MHLGLDEEFFIWPLFLLTEAVNHTILRDMARFINRDDANVRGGSMNNGTSFSPYTTQDEIAPSVSEGDCFFHFY